MEVNYAQIDTPHGQIVVVASADEVIRVEWVKNVSETGYDDLLAMLERHDMQPVMQSNAILAAAKQQLDEYFAGERREFELPIDWSQLHGFNRQVLEATAAIPYGSVLTYQQIAAKAGSPRASRAAGNALKTNPIAVVIPCHRVIRSDGSIGGYAGVSGSSYKQALLDIEKVC